MFNLDGVDSILLLINPQFQIQFEHIGSLSLVGSQISKLTKKDGLLLLFICLALRKITHASTGRRSNWADSAGCLAGYSSWRIILSFYAAISFWRIQNKNYISTIKFSWANFKLTVWLSKWFFKQGWNIFVFWDQVKHLWRSIHKRGSVSNHLKLVSDLDL